MYFPIRRSFPVLPENRTIPFGLLVHIPTLKFLKRKFKTQNGLIFYNRAKAVKTTNSLKRSNSEKYVPDLVTDGLESAYFAVWSARRSHRPVFNRFFYIRPRTYTATCLLK